MRAAGGVLAGAGGVLVFVGVVWAAVGFSMTQAPVLLGLLLVGGLLALVGGRMAKGDGRPELPAGARVVAAPPIPAVPAGPAAASVVPPDADAARLAELAAAHPELWPEIERHPNAYPALLDWIASSRAARADSVPAAVDDDARRAADPGTSAAELAEIAHRRADLRAVVAAHPSAYDALREWIGQYPT